MAKKAPVKPESLKNAGKSTARPGNGGARPNAGRKSKAAMLGLIALLDECWTETDRRECVKTLAAAAKAGDMDATKLLFNYAFGRPKEVKEHGGIDGAAIKHEVTVHRVDRPIDSDQ